MAVATAAVVGTAVSAYSAYDSAQARKKALKQQEKEGEKPSTSQLSPWGPTEDPINQILGDAFRGYQQGPNYIGGGGGGGFGGGGGSAAGGGGGGGGGRPGVPEGWHGKWRKHDPLDLAERRIKLGKERPGDRELLANADRSIPGAGGGSGLVSTQRNQAPAGPDNSRQGLIDQLAAGPQGQDADALRGWANDRLDPNFRGNALQQDLWGRMGDVSLDRAGSHFDQWVKDPGEYSQFGDRPPMVGAPNTPFSPTPPVPPASTPGSTYSPTQDTSMVTSQTPSAFTPTPQGQPAPQYQPAGANSQGRIPIQESGPMGQDELMEFYRSSGQGHKADKLQRKLQRQASGAGAGGGQGGGSGQGLSGPQPGGNWTPESKAQQELRFFFDDARLDPANDPTMKPFLDALRQEQQESQEAALNDVAGLYDAGGMFGSSLRALEQGDVRDQFNENLANQQASTLFGSRQNALGQRMDAAGLLSRDELGYANIDAQKQAAASARAAASANAAAQRQAAQHQAQLQYDLGLRGIDLERTLGLRGQDIGVANALMGNDQFGLNLMGGMGQSVAGQQDAAAGALGGLVGQQGQMLGTAGGLQTDWELGNLNAQTQRRIAGANRNLQRDMFNAQQDYNHFANYLDLFMAPGTAFGQHTSTGPNPYAGASAGAPNPWVAGLGAGAAALGGAAGAGAFGGGGGMSLSQGQNALGFQTVGQNPAVTNMPMPTYDPSMGGG